MSLPILKGTPKKLASEILTNRPKDRHNLISSNLIKLEKINFDKTGFI